MSPLVNAANQILSLLTIAAQIGIAIFLAALLSDQGAMQKLLRFVSKNALLLSLIVAFTATLGSLFYSEIAGFVPCKLCWFQRIFMYPQAILFAIALWKNDKHVNTYGIALSGVGAFIAGYHYLLQREIVPSLPCSAVGYSPSCSQVFVLNFDYITIPLMAFTAFLSLLVLQIAIKRNKTTVAS